MSFEQLELLRREQIGDERRVDQHVAVLLEHAGGFLQGGHEEVELLDDVAAPDEVEVAVGMRECFQHAVNDLDTRAELRRRHCGARPRNVDLDGIDADPGRVVRPDEPNQVRRIAAAGVEDDGPRREIAGGEIVQRVGPARLEASVKEAVHAPRLLAVDPRQLLEVRRHLYRRLREA